MATNYDVLFLRTLETCLLQPIDFFNSSHVKFYYSMCTYIGACVNALSRLTFFS